MENQAQSFVFLNIEKIVEKSEDALNVRNPTSIYITQAYFENLFSLHLSSFLADLNEAFYILNNIFKK